MQNIAMVCDREGVRLDQYINSRGLGLTRSYIQKLIKDGNIKVNEKFEKSSYRVDIGDEILLALPDPEEIELMPEDIPLDIYYEDEDLILVNKPKDMVVHPAAGHYSQTLVNALLFHCKSSLSGINGKLRPGIVHRIDKDTTGLIIACKNDKAHEHIANQLREHSIKRLYRAIVCGVLKEDSGTIDRPLGRNPLDRKKIAICEDGKKSITHYRVLQRFKNHTYIECRLETGRTHQIRVHMASIGHPLLGDVIYGKKDEFKLRGQTLHAMVLGFIHPKSGEYLEFSAKLPDYFEHLLHIL
ncbi:MAG: RluA family pseudouridine synthase [Johnsonella sp.]|nr:RluA family pseudouridine synthase [Johnsonella sp.]